MKWKEACQIQKPSNDAKDVSTTADKIFVSSIIGGHIIINISTGKKKSSLLSYL